MSSACTVLRSTSTTTGRMVLAYITQHEGRLGAASVDFTFSCTAGSCTANALRRRIASAPLSAPSSASPSGDSSPTALSASCGHPALIMRAVYRDSIIQEYNVIASGVTNCRSPTPALICVVVQTAIQTQTRSSLQKKPHFAVPVHPAIQIAQGLTEGTMNAMQMRESPRLPYWIKHQWQPHGNENKEGSQSLVYVAHPTVRGGAEYNIP